MRKQLEVNVLGIDLKISERSTQDVLDLAEFSQGNMNGLKALRISTILLNQSFTYWISKHWFIKRWLLNRKLSVNKLTKGLSPKEITELGEKVLELEGNKKKVKKKEKQSAEMSQEV